MGYQNTIDAQGNKTPRTWRLAHPVMKKVSGKISFAISWSPSCNRILIINHLIHHTPMVACNMRELCCLHSSELE